jgi:hypothetical protein
LDQDAGAADLPAAELAWWMFHRWSQENWFKYMRTEYALDVLARIIHEGLRIEKRCVREPLM